MVMRHLGAFEAKTHFSEILASVLKGNKFVITKRGVEVAMLVPCSKKDDEINPVEDAIRALKKLRKGVTLGKKFSIREMINEGRE